LAEVCTKCGLPTDICACEELEKDQARIVVRLEMRRFSKKGTMIEGLNPKRSNLSKITHSLKRKFACGGAVKGGTIILQGDHRRDVKDELIQLGFNENSIEIQ
jgi:translation initiation factor 1